MVDIKLTPGASPAPAAGNTNQVTPNTALGGTSAGTLSPDAQGAPTLPAGTSLLAKVIASKPLASPSAATPTLPADQTPPTSTAARTTTAALTAKSTAALFEIVFSGQQQGKPVTLTSHSRFPLPIGQLAQLQTNTDGSLQLLKLLPATNSPAASPQAKLDTIQHALLRYQPAAGARPSLPSLLNQLLPVLTRLEQTQAPQLKPLQQRLQQLVQQPLTLRQLKQPQALKQALLDSGSHFEAKLKHLQQQLPNPQSKSTAQSHPGRSESTPSQAGNNLYQTKGAPSQAARHSNQPANNPGQARPNPSNPPLEPIAAKLNQQPGLRRAGEKVLNQDLKGQLIQLTQTLQQTLAASPNSTSQPTADKPLLMQLLQLLHATTGTQRTTPGTHSASSNPQPGPGAGINTLLTTLLQPLRHAGAQSAGNPAGNNGEPDQLIQQLQRLLLSSLAKIQVNQLQSTASQHTGSEAGIQQSWLFDLPLYNGQEFRNIHIEIDREAQSQTANNEATSAWKVTLGFDLPGLGEFYATLKVVEESVSTTFWSEQPQTLQRITQELGVLKQSLQRLGLEVNELDCRHGTPAKRQAVLDHQIVDIRT